MKLLRKVILENFESGMRIIRPTKDTLGKPNNARTNNIISLHGEIARKNNRTRNNADLYQNAPPNPPAPKNPDALPKNSRKRATREDAGVIPLTLPMIEEVTKRDLKKAIQADAATRDYARRLRASAAARKKGGVSPENNADVDRGHEGSDRASLKVARLPDGRRDAAVAAARKPQRPAPQAISSSRVYPLTLPMIAESNRELRDKRDRAALTKIYSKNWTGALPSPPPQEPMPPGAPPKKGKDGPAATYLRSRRDSRQSGRSKARQIAIARSQGNPTGAPGTQPSVTGQLQAEPRKKIKAGTWKGNRYPHDLGRTVPKEEADKWEREDRS
jgi:hypothetical protein